jgi:hypothetical protein
MSSGGKSPLLPTVISKQDVTQSPGIPHRTLEIPVSSGVYFARLRVSKRFRRGNVREDEQAPPNEIAFAGLEHESLIREGWALLFHGDQNNKTDGASPCDPTDPTRGHM